MIRHISFEQSSSVWEATYKENSLQLPFFTHAWQQRWFEILSNGWEPYTILVDDALIAPFARKGNEIIFSGGEEISDYQDMIGPDETKAAAWPQILAFLKTQNVTSLHFRNVPQSSPTVSFFQQFPGATVAKEDTTPLLPLPASWESYIEGLPYKQRHELRRKIRKIEREHAHIHMEESSDPQHDINRLLALMRKDKKKASFLTPDMTLFFQKLADVFRDQISLLILFMDDNPAAATLSFITNEASLLYNSGFDKQCCPNASWYLKAMSIKHAIVRGTREYNFLQGSERYKYDLGGKDFFVYSIYLRL